MGSRARIHDHWTPVCLCACVCACMWVGVRVYLWRLPPSMTHVATLSGQQCPRAQVTRCVTNLSVLSTQVLRRHQGGWGGKMKEWHEAGCAALLVTVCRTRNCIVKPRELKLGRSNIVFSHSTYPILVPVSIVVRKCRERNTAFWSTVYRVRGFYRCLEVFI